MHIVFGGLFNGKTDYVNEHFIPEVMIEVDLEKVSVTGKVIAIRNFQQLVKPYLQLDEVEAGKKIFSEIASLATNNTVICICDDVSRGVVPIDKEERKMRDVLGRLYQQLFQEAQSVTRIWYGIPEKIK